VPRWNWRIQWRSEPFSCRRGRWRRFRPLRRCPRHRPALVPLRPDRLTLPPNPCHTRRRTATDAITGLRCCRLRTLSACVTALRRPVATRSSMEIIDFGVVDLTAIITATEGSRYIHIVNTVAEESRIRNGFPYMISWWRKYQKHQKNEKKKKMREGCEIQLFFFFNFEKKNRYRWIEVQVFPIKPKFIFRMLIPARDSVSSTVRVPLTTVWHETTIPLRRYTCCFWQFRVLTVATRVQFCTTRLFKWVRIFPWHFFFLLKLVKIILVDLYISWWICRSINDGDIVAGHVGIVENDKTLNLLEIGVSGYYERKEMP